MVLSSISARVGFGALAESTAARDLARWVGRLNAVACDPRRGVRVVLHLLDADEPSRKSLVHRSEPHEMVRVDWPVVVADCAAGVPAHRLHEVLLDVIHRVVDLAPAQGFAVDEAALIAAVNVILIEPPPRRILDHLTAQALQVLWVVRRGEGAWDARQVDLRLGTQGGDLEGGIMPELEYLESQGLVARRMDSDALRWAILPGGERLIAAHDRLP